MTLISIIDNFKFGKILSSLSHFLSYIEILFKFRPWTTSICSDMCCVISTRSKYNKNCHIVGALYPEHIDCDIFNRFI